MAGESRAVPNLDPARPLSAEVLVPGSKSLTNRALVLAALAGGRSELEGVLWSDDTLVCMRALRQLGVPCAADEERRLVVVEGARGGPPAPSGDIEVGMAGTAARFLPPWLALGRGVYHVDGAPRMRQRPMGPLHEALRAQGVRIDGGPALPWTVHGAGGLAGGELRMGGGETSQPASGMLMAAPFARQDTHLVVETHRAALPFVAMTAAVMESFGVPVRERGAGRWLVPAGARYGPRRYRVEPDASAAAYFWALAALSGGRVRTPGIGPSRLQGDAGLLQVLREMGCTVRNEDGAVVQGPPAGRIRHGSWDLSAMADQAITVGVLGLFADGPVRVGNVAHIRQHETDRIAAVVQELARLGARCEEHEDGFTVWPLDGPHHPATVQTFGDHRMAMGFGVAATRLAGVRIADPEVVSKTFPEFFAVLERALGAAPTDRGRTADPDLDP